MLYFVPTPIGNLEDITLRSLRLLASTKTIFCEDTRVAKKLISLLSEKNSFEFQPKNYISLHSHNEKRVLSSLDIKIFEDDVVYLSDAGMPGISDPGCELVRYAQKHSIEYDVLPGASASLLAYVASGFCQKEFLFFGFLPHKGRDRDEALERVLNSGFVAILYEAPHRITKLIDALSTKVPDREIFLIKEATKLHQTTIKGVSTKVKEKLKEINTKGEWVVVIDAFEKEFNTLTTDDILALKIPKKEASKLLSKLTGKPVKECYNQLISKEQPQG